jgi:hypothetical protein
MEKENRDYLLRPGSKWHEHIKYAEKIYIIIIIVIVILMPQPIKASHFRFPMKTLR